MAVDGVEKQKTRANPVAVPHSPGLRMKGPCLTVPPWVRRLNLNKIEPKGNSKEN